MAGNGDEADFFAIPNFWQASRLLQQVRVAPETTSSFFATDVIKDASSLPTVTGLITLAPIEPPKHGFFKVPAHEAAAIPAVDESVALSESESDGLFSILEDSEEEEPGDASDLWLELKIPSKPKPLHRTWDAFIAGKSVTMLEPMFVSEAGSTAYDALLCSPNDPLELENAAVPVVDIENYLSSLLALALGRESVLFSRQDDPRKFKPALPKMRASGYSREVLQGLESLCLRCGAALWDLRSFIQLAYSSQSSRCGVALASTVGQVIQVVQEWVAGDGRNPPSLLQLQSIVNSVLAILKPFQALTSQLRQDLTDEDILALVFHQSYAVDDDEEYLRQMMREVLQRVSGPWVEFLEAWIGTRREEGLPLTKSNVGESKGFVKVEAKVVMDDFGREAEEVDFVLDPDKMPRFMPDDVTELIFETGRNLRFIRSFHPDHPLAQQDFIAASKPPKAEWLYDWNAILQLESRVAEYRDNLLAAIQASCSESSRNSVAAIAPSSKHGSGFQLTFFGLDEVGMEQRLLASIDQLAQPISTHDTKDSLSKIVHERLSGAYEPGIDHSNSTPHWSLLPVLSFGGLASAQAQAVNKETLRLLFTAHDLRGHLRLQREFHLLGNGMFCSRLSHALFDPDLEPAARRPGVARQGSVMGLRLGGRDTWPPASSELRLALMGILAETYDSKSGPKMEEPQRAFNTDGSDLPGDMSFAVRDLSSEEIDRCMNPDSLEALDFLRLSYTAPPQLSCVITPMNLVQYDRIFKLLLRVLRMLFVVNQLFRDVGRMARRWEDPGGASFRFVREAQHFVSGIAAYFLDTGVAVPWQMLEKKLDKIQADLNKPSAGKELQSPDRLRGLHSLVLDRIINALFLRKKQQPVLKFLEEIFNTILQFAKYVRLRSLGGGGGGGGNIKEKEELDPSVLYSRFKKKVQVFITVCRGLSEKGRRAGDKKAEEDKALREQYGTGDESMVAQLLAKLDMFDYYLRR